MEEAAFFDADQQLTEVQMIAVDCSTLALVILHNYVFLVGSHKPKVVLEFREVLLVLHDEVVDVNDLVCQLSFEKSPIGLLHRVIRSQQEHLI